MWPNAFFVLISLSKCSDILLCQESCQTEYLNCIENCAGDPDCGLECNRSYVKCEENCNFEKVENVTFLVLNSAQISRARLFNWEIAQNEEIFALRDFYDPESSAYASCSINYKEKMYIIGGQFDNRQISVVNGCSLTRYKSGTPFFKGLVRNFFSKISSRNPDVIFRLDINLPVRFNPEAYFAELFSTVNFLGDVYVFGGRFRSYFRYYFGFIFFSKKTSFISFKNKGS